MRMPLDLPQLCAGRISCPAVAYPLPFRAKVLAAYRKGATTREVAEEFGIDSVTVSNWVRLDKAHGAPLSGRPGPASVWTPRRLLALLAMHRRLPKATSLELALLQAPKIGRRLPGQAIRRALAEAKRLEKELRRAKLVHKTRR